jgi:hypothetical protein
MRPHGHGRASPARTPLPRRPAAYGYRLTDAGPRPNRPKAADGRRLHALALDDPAAIVVARIFGQFIAGDGLFAMAESLTRDATGAGVLNVIDVPRAEKHPGSAVVMKSIPAGCQTNRVVFSPDGQDLWVASLVRQRTTQAGSWIYSEQIAHPPVISSDDVGQAQDVLAARGRRPCQHKPHATPRSYAFGGAVFCGSALLWRRRRART